MRYQSSDDDAAPTDAQLREWLHADPITLDAIPEVYALYRDADPDDEDAEEPGVAAWVFALPDGKVYVLSAGDGKRQICASGSLVRVGSFWAPMFGADLVAVRTAR